MEIQKEFKILSAEKDDNGKYRLKFNNPVLLPVLLLISAMVVSFIFLAAKQITDRYYPFEGKVLKIEIKWYDNFLFETNYDEHLILETNDGKIIDRYIDQFERIKSSIEIGDYVIKLKGFRQNPRAKGKKTADEIINELKSK